MELQACAPPSSWAAQYDGYAHLHRLADDVEGWLQEANKRSKELSLTKIRLELANVTKGLQKVGSSIARSFRAARRPAPQPHKPSALVVTGGAGSSWPAADPALAGLRAQEMCEVRLQLASALSQATVLRHEMFRWKQKSAVVKLKQTAAEETNKMLYGSNKLLVQELHSAKGLASGLREQLAEAQRQLQAARSGLATEQVGRCLRSRGGSGAGAAARRWREAPLLLHPHALHAALRAGGAAQGDGSRGRAAAGAGGGAAPAAAAAGPGGAAGAAAVRRPGAAGAGAGGAAGRALRD
jgi:hypothetical protein